MSVPTNVPSITLNDGVVIPQLGFGVWQVGADEIVPAVATALEAGYRHLDTAAAYGNEDGVGKAIAESGIAREELFVTTKLWNSDHKADDARRAIETSLEKLGLDHLDLYLIHWPATVKYGDAYIEAWDSMQQFKAEGLVRSIGVSNFVQQHLDKLQGTTPSVNQIEVHPTFQQRELRELNTSRGITTEVYTPLGTQSQPGDITLPEVTALAEAVGKTPAQVVLRWHLQQGLVVFPKSVTPTRISENFDVFDFELSDDQMAVLNGLDRGFRQGADPVTAGF
ncbi:aldo/keto reductase [Aestuariimicrobium kwangyangense]|uniref:aldo/keto reductase n=1 Tax=Aestuariimicrobium kwangyangense TaxID=396389 RepID=UPI0003F8AC26|nr:aldo/keto reductase [Aestuariimicrobium kwangyangense]